MSPLNDYQHIAENMYNHPLITDNFNAEVEDHYFSVLDSLRRGEHALAQKSLETSLTLIRKRQKLIKLADKSDTGWFFVQEYEQDNLADNLEDEKLSRKRRIKPAERQIHPV